jgi:tripartite-type tricarboxylate transporter receptor subunit TctC
VPVKSVKDMIAHAKANPGAQLRLGVGFADHLAGELFGTLAGSGCSTCRTGWGARHGRPRGRQRPADFATISTALASMKANRIRPLAVTSAKRVERFAELPTVAEAGCPASPSTAAGFQAPAAPKPVVGKLH